MESTTPGTPIRPITEGTAQVHSHVTTTAAEPTPAYTATPQQDKSTMDRAKDSAHGMADQAKDRAQDLGHKASDAASQARQKAGETLGQVQDKLEESGMLDTVRDNALPALGIAFGLGFLLAGSDSGRKGGTMYKAKNQLKGAVMGGLSAAVANEARSMLGISGSSGGKGGLLSSLMGGGSGSQQRGGSGSGSGSQQRGGSGGSRIITDTTSDAMGRSGGGY